MIGVWRGSPFDAGETLQQARAKVMMTMAGSDPERIRLEEEVGYNWEELGRLARRLEKDLDEQLLGLGQLVARNAPCHEDQLAGLEKTLRTLSSVINMMDELLEGLGTGVSNERSKAGVSAAHLLNRHRELLQEYGRDFRKVKVKIFVYDRHNMYTIV